MADSYSLIGQLVLPDRLVPDGALVVRDGVIAFSGREKDAPAGSLEGARRIDGLIAPGFVDIHCHAGTVAYCHIEQEETARHHLEHGTTGMLMTMYRNIPHDVILATCDKIKALMPKYRNILGVHLEGPYLNMKYGSGDAPYEPIDPVKYKELADTGLVRQWTCAPELEGTEEFIRYITSRSITAAIGHSEADAVDVIRAEKAGATLVTHLFDATGKKHDPPQFAGTIEVSFNVATLIRDNFMYEIICDRNGVHVRPELVELAIKCVGVDRIVGITDCCSGDPAESDINVVDGELTGSKLTMDRAAQNFYALGLTVPEVFRVCSLNGAKAIQMDDRIGSLEAGKQADVLILDSALNLKEVLKA